jgi:hypothetical protein
MNGHDITKKALARVKLFVDDATLEEVACGPGCRCGLGLDDANGVALAVAAKLLDEVCLDPDWWGGTDVLRALYGTEERGYEDCFEAQCDHNRNALNWQEAGRRLRPESAT